MGEADGHFFLSMEMVDGENLASLLRRIGRLPPDKALDIARQLCAGLAAAHEKGVLHRDLKPANLMLDGQGNVRITDFGLAGLAESLREEDVRSGTPCYMSPEQLQGREVSVRSDIYALGLVLYELYTGRRAFQGKSLAEYVRKHRDERPIEPSALVAGLDPAVERAILACLEKEPRRRPSSALVVAAMLTGSDPLEAAIAAGETPSPELVAAAGEAEGLRPAVAWGLLAVVLAGLALVPLAGRSFRLLERVPAGKPPAVLEDRARDLVRRVAAAEPAIDDAWGLSVDWSYLGEVREKDKSPSRWDALASGNPPVLQFWYRESPRPLVSLLPSGKVYGMKPGLDVTGMAGATYDMEGRLLRFYHVPVQLEGDAEAPAPTAPDWSPLLAEARLDPGALRAVEPKWVPPFFADARAAWEGTWPGRPDVPIRVEAAAHRGKPVWFEIVWPWTRPERMEKYAWPAGKLLRQALWITLSLVLLAAAAFMARRNIVLGRGDRRGAFRVALLLAGAGILVLGARGPPRGRLERRVEPRRPRGGPGRAPGGLRVALLPRGRAVRAAAAPLDPRVVDAVPRRRARRPGGRPGHARRPRLGRAPVRPRAAALRPPGPLRPAPSRPDERLPGPAPGAAPLLGSMLGLASEATLFSMGAHAALRPRPPAPPEGRPGGRGRRRAPARPRRARRAASRRGSRCP